MDEQTNSQRRFTAIELPVLQIVDAGIGLFELFEDLFGGAAIGFGAGLYLGYRGASLGTLPHPQEDLPPPGLP